MKDHYRVESPGSLLLPPGAIMAETLDIVAAHLAAIVGAGIRVLVGTRTLCTCRDFSMDYHSLHGIP